MSASKVEIPWNEMHKDLVNVKLFKFQNSVWTWPLQLAISHLSEKSGYCSYDFILKSCSVTCASNGLNPFTVTLNNCINV